MRVVYLNPIARPGGAERSLIDVWASLKALAPGLDLHLVCGEDGPLRADAERHGVAFHVLPMPAGLTRLGDAGAGLAGKLGPACRVACRLAGLGGTTAAYAVRLRSLLDKLRPTLLHSNGMKYHVLTGLARPAGVPIVWHIRDFITPRPLLRRLLRLARRGVSLAVGNSEATAADARTALPGVKVVAVHNGIDLDTFRPGPAEPARLDQLAGLPAAPPRTVRVGLVATYARWKGQDLLLRAVSRLAAESPDIAVRFYIIGGPIYRTDDSQFTQEQLRRLAESLGCPPVGFVPFQDRPADIYRALDIVVHASTRAEPYGRTVVEAMACGRAVVASLAGGVAELIEPGTDALGFPPNNEAGLVAAISRLARDLELRARLAFNARGSASRFSRALMGTRLLHLYQDLAGDQGRS
jgi:glycosyltransferase involved in cell wall biosynthesis